MYCEKNGSKYVVWYLQILFDVSFKQKTSNPIAFPKVKEFIAQQN